MGFFSPDTVTDFVRRGDVEGVRRRLELGDDVNERRMFQYTPLIEAAMCNRCDIIQVLLDHNADVELTDSNNLTALHMAIDKKQVDAALLLARHGANANEIGFLDRTPLQSAVKRNLLEVTSELLRFGADPVIYNKNKKCAKDYVPWGLNGERFRELLTVYTDLESAIRAKHEPAITVQLRKALTGDPRATTSGIDAAILLRQMDALSAILDVTLSTWEFEDQIQKFKAIETGIETATDADWSESLTVIRDDYTTKWLEQTLLSQDLDKLQLLVESVAKREFIQQVMFTNGWTSLHYAASLNNLALVQYLLAECGLNPLALSSEEKTACDVAVETGNNSEMCWLLQQHMKKRTFADESAVLLKTEDVTVVGLQQLIKTMTSVYDLRIIFILGFQALTSEEMHVVVIQAFDEIIREKLVLNDCAATFFKLGLQECRRHNFLSEMEQIEWDLKATKVNMENAEWVQGIKHALQEVEGRVATTERNVELLHTQFDALRNALIHREKCQIKQRERQRYISLLSTALIMCGGGVIKDSFGAVFDVWNPEELLSALSADHMTDFLAEKTNTFMFKGGVESLLLDAAVDPLDFAVVLRDAIRLERTETTTFETPLLPRSDEEEFVNPLFPPRKISSFKAAVLAAVEAAKAEGEEEKLIPKSLPATSALPESSTSTEMNSEISEMDLAEYPYHYAVRFSEGDFDRFHELAQSIEEEDGEINETLTIFVRPAKSDDTSNRWETIEASALVYASYLGYVEIVKWFLARTDMVKKEKSFLTIKRSRSSLTDGNEVRIKQLAPGA